MHRIVQTEQPMDIFQRRMLSDMSLSKNHQFSTVPRGIPLSFMPGKGDFVAIDAEFVSLQKEEAEIRSDGHRSTTKPAHMACARISLVYGSGPQKGRVIVDDYIKMSEPVGADMISHALYFADIFKTSAACPWLIMHA